MNEIRENGGSFVGYEYKEIRTAGVNVSLYLDCYRNFGWTVDDRTPGEAFRGRGILILKRDRRIANRMELTRLQRHFEACLEELKALERSKTSGATACSIAVGLAGTCFMAGATFASVRVPPLIPLAVLLAVPGFIGWILPVFLYRQMVRRRTGIVARLKERKYDEIYEICEKGYKLMDS